jgi:hypothetical protein
MSLTDLAKIARKYVADGDAMLRLCLQFIDDFGEADPEVRVSLLESAPRSTGDVRWDAFLAALAEHLAYHNDLRVPAWTDGKARFLGRWWFPSDLPSVKSAALVESPAAFRRRGIFVTEDLFDRA